MTTGPDDGPPALRDPPHEYRITFRETAYGRIRSRTIGTPRDGVPRLAVPVLVLHGEQDRICTERWARRLADTAGDGRFASMPGAHTFPWADPEEWSEPVRPLAAPAG